MNDKYIIISILLIITISCIYMQTQNKTDNNVIIIGSGLAGLSAAISILEKGGNVILLEKQENLGGNSSKASSGINGVYTTQQKKHQILDSTDFFFKDTMKSTSYNKEPYTTLVNQLVNHSNSAIEWLQERNINLNNVAILGGHTNARTHRPDSNVLVGIEIISKLIQYLERFPNQLEIYKNTTVIKIIKAGNKVVGVECENTNKGRFNLSSQSIILATGGYANDHSKMSLLYKHRPDLKKLPTTNSSATTGDGVKMGMLLGIKTRDLDQIQVHPTGFIDLKDKMNKTKTLCGEVMRGVGGILVNASGERFCNELGTRQYVVDQMANQNTDKFIILLNQESANKVESHLNHYISNNLFYKVQNINELSKKIQIDVTKIKDTFTKYNKAVDEKKDTFGKKVFPTKFKDDILYYGYVTPVLHYCMGGLEINEKCEVLTDNGIISNLYAAGEVTSGIHGKNRLGGNSLLECNVYGRIAGNEALKHININYLYVFNTLINLLSKIKLPNISVGRKSITADELAKHNNENDAWMAIDDNVYNVTDYMNKHPGGKEAILRYAGKDATEAFYQIHEKYMLEELKIVGKFIKN